MGISNLICLTYILKRQQLQILKKISHQLVISFKCRNNNAHTQQTFTCSNSIIETGEKGVKNVKS